MAMKSFIEGILEMLEGAGLALVRMDREGYAELNKEYTVRDLRRFKYPNLVAEISEMDNGWEAAGASALGITKEELADKVFAQKGEDEGLANGALAKMAQAYGHGMDYLFAEEPEVVYGIYTRAFVRASEERYQEHTINGA